METNMFKLIKKDSENAAASPEEKISNDEGVGEVDL